MFMLTNKICCCYIYNQELKTLWCHTSTTKNANSYIGVETSMPRMAIAFINTVLSRRIWNRLKLVFFSFIARMEMCTTWHMF